MSFTVARACHVKQAAPLTMKIGVLNLKHISSIGVSGYMLIHCNATCIYDAIGSAPLVRRGAGDTFASLAHTPLHVFS